MAFLCGVYNSIIMHKKKYYIISGILAVIIIGLVGARLYLNVWLPKYVNQVLNNIEGYQGSVEDIDIALYRGAYKIHKLKLFKKNGNIPVPFIDIDLVDLSIQWHSLLQGRVVSDVKLIKPILNFAVNKSDTAQQTGGDVDWIKPIKDLMPIDINLVTFNQGKLTYQDFSKSPQVNVYINDMSGEISNLRNVTDGGEALPSTIIVKGNSIGNGRLDINGKLNILKKVPDMDINAQLENIDLTALSNYTHAYAAIDIRGGSLNIYSKVAVKDSNVSGYVKPIAKGVSLIDLGKEKNPVKAIWQTVVAVVVEIFTNQSKDQFATTVPLEGKLGSINTDKWEALIGIIRNAFVESVKAGFDNNIKPQKP